MLGVTGVTEVSHDVKISVLYQKFMVLPLFSLVAICLHGSLIPSNLTVLF